MLGEQIPAGSKTKLRTFPSPWLMPWFRPRSTPGPGRQLSAGSMGPEFLPPLMLASHSVEHLTLFYTVAERAPSVSAEVTARCLVSQDVTLASLHSHPPGRHAQGLVPPGEAYQLAARMNKRNLMPFLLLWYQCDSRGSERWVPCPRSHSLSVADD